MNCSAKFRSIAPVVVGLLGMAAYQIISRLYHPAIMEKDWFHGLWFGVCLGLEITGIYRLSRNRQRE